MSKYIIPIALLLISSCSLRESSINVTPFKFAYLSDIHIDASTTSVEDLVFAINDINKQEDLSFVIFAGDITEFGSDSELSLAKSLIEGIKIPYWVLSGNHDSKWSESGCNSFVRLFGYETFFFEQNGVGFIGTNSGPNMRMAPALVPHQTMVWLDSLTYELPSKMPVISVNHYPLDSSMLNSSQFLTYLKRTNIQLAMCGHGHTNKELQYDGVAGVMGRSNLRGDHHWGYNIVSIFGDSLHISSRSNGYTTSPWYKMKLKHRKRRTTTPPWSTTSQTSNSHSTSAPSADAQSATSANNHSATSAPDQSPHLTTIWSYQDNADIGSAPAHQFGLIFISNSAGQIKALDATSGAPIWSYQTGGKIFSSPAIHERYGLLIVGSSDNYIYALEARTGKLAWRVAANKSVLGSPTIFNDIAYIGASDGIFRALDVLTGKLIWSYDKIAGFIESKPWVDSQGVYIGDWANKLYAFDPLTGTPLWEWTNHKGRGYSAAAVWPVKADGKLFIVTPERRSYALDAKTGKELWSAYGGRESIGLSEDGKYLYVKSMKDTLIAISTGNFDPIASRPVIHWKSIAGYGYDIAPSPITAAHGLILIPTDKGSIFALNSQDGNFLWQHKFSDALINHILPLGNHQFAITSMDGKVALLQLN